jgi:hypothetical protein
MNPRRSQNFSGFQKFQCADQFSDKSYQYNLPLILKTSSSARTFIISPAICPHHVHPHISRRSALALTWLSILSISYLTTFRHRSSPANLFRALQSAEIRAVASFQEINFRFCALSIFRMALHFCSYLFFPQRRKDSMK